MRDVNILLSLLEGVFIRFYPVFVLMSVECAGTQIWARLLPLLAWLGSAPEGFKSCFGTKCGSWTDVKVKVR